MSPYCFITVKVRIEAIVIEPIIAIKIYKKHRVTTKEIRLVLKENAPIFRKVGAKHYMAIGLFHRYLTIFFTYDSKLKTAYIQTAYPSARWQIKLYKRRKK